MTFVARNALLAACRAWQQQVPLAAAAHRGLDAAPGALQHRGYAAATAGVVPADLDTLDRIILKGLVFHGFHGALPEVRISCIENGSMACSARYQRRASTAHHLGGRRKTCWGKSSL
jgi:hypothetical protein